MDSLRAAPLSQVWAPTAKSYFRWHGSIMRDSVSLSDRQATLTNKSRICVLADVFSLANARISPQARERMAIREWPVDKCLLEKLLARGPEALSDAELLAIMLRTGIPLRSGYWPICDYRLARNRDPPQRNRIKRAATTSLRST
jgi:hypothetical protein